MAIKIYKPTDSLQVYFESVGGSIMPVTASHLRIYENDADETFSIKDELNSMVVRDVPHGDIQDELGDPAGADYAAVKLYLSKIIG